jgi:hypothetical protein
MMRGAPKDSYRIKLSGQTNGKYVKYEQDGDNGVPGGKGSGNRSKSSNSSWVAPAAIFFACWRLM